MSRSNRENRRPGYAIEFYCGNQNFHAKLGFDGRKLIEVFLTCGKIGSDANLIMREASILLSYALQSGADPEEMKASMPRRNNGSPEGPIGTLLDLITSEAEKDAMEEMLE